MCQYAPFVDEELMQGNGDQPESQETAGQDSPTPKLVDEFNMDHIES